LQSTFKIDFEPVIDSKYIIKDIKRALESNALALIFE